MRKLLIFLLVSFSAKSQVHITVNGNSTNADEPRITAPNTPAKYWNGYKVFASLNTDSVVELTNQYFTNARARGAISITTTGTGGAATYDNSTGSLNIPIYSNPAFSGMRVYNVENYGALHNGSTDDTHAIQLAINAADSLHGGIVYFPNGIYKISGALQTNVGGLNMNSQIYIPYRAITDTSRTHIKLLGESPPNFSPDGGGLSIGATLPVVTSGVILKSTNTGAVSGSAVIGTAGSYNYNYLTVENITIETKNNSSGGGVGIGGINYSRGASLICRNVVITIDTSGYRSAVPTNSVAGIETTDNSSESFNNLENCYVIGYRAGYKVGEHVTMNQVQAFCCYRGFEFKAGYHATSATRIGAYWCAYDIYVSGFCDFENLELDDEWQQIGKWYDAVNTIKDSANLAHGTVFYHIVSAGVGVDDTKFSKSGGSGIIAISSRSPIPTISSGTTAPGSTPGKVGDIYVDITNKKLYFAAGTSSSADWIIAN